MDSRSRDSETSASFSPPSEAVVSPTPLFTANSFGVDKDANGNLLGSGNFDKYDNAASVGNAHPSNNRHADRPAVAPKPSPRLPPKHTLPPSSASLTPSTAWTEPANVSAVTENNKPSSSSSASVPSTPTVSISRSLAEEAMRARIAKVGKEGNGLIAETSLAGDHGVVDRPRSPHVYAGSNKQQSMMPSFDEEEDRLNPFVFPPNSPNAGRQQFSAELDNIDPFAETPGGLPGAVYD